MRYLVAGLLLALSAAPRPAWAAACCGGGSTFPSLIVGDERAQFGFTSSWGRVVGDAPNQGRAVFRSASDHESVQTYAFDGAMIVSDRWQIGGMLPLVRRARSVGDVSASDFGLGDASLTVGFEVLPEYTYSKWKPRGFVFLQTILPSGGNIYEAQSPYAVDARGRGFTYLSVGFILLKTWSSWDVSLRGNLNKGLDHTFTSPDGSALYAKPGFDWGVAIGLGYNLEEWRFGLSINPVFEGTSNIAASKLVWNTGLDTSWLFAKAWAATLSYADQTLLGPARNVSLSRTLTLGFKYKWDR